MQTSKTIAGALKSQTANGNLAMVMTRDEDREGGHIGVCYDAHGMGQ